MSAMNGFECSFTALLTTMNESECSFTALPMLIFDFQYHLQIAAAATTTNNNGSKSPEDWKGREGSDEEEASTIWHGGCCGWTLNLDRRV